MDNKCPAGFIRRRGYTRKSGAQVKSACIKKTSSISRKICPPGQISRKGHMRHVTARVHAEGYLRTSKTGKTVKVFPKMKSVFVKPSCLKGHARYARHARYANSKLATPRIGPLRKGELKKFGYIYKLPEAQRHAALKRAIGAMGPLDIYRKLDAVAKLSTRAAPAASSVFGKDRDWIHKTYENASGILHA